MVVGFVLGLIFKEKILFVKIFVDIFLRLVQMSIDVLIMTAVIDALVNTDGEKIGKLGSRLVMRFTFGTIIAALIGTVEGNLLPVSSIKLTVTKVFEA